MSGREGRRGEDGMEGWRGEGWEERNGGGENGFGLGRKDTSYSPSGTDGLCLISDKGQTLNSYHVALD